MNKDEIIKTYLTGNVQNLRYLITVSNDINELNNDGETALTWACDNDEIKLVDMLLNNTTIDVNKKNEFGHSPLSIACYNGNVAIAKLLLQRDDIKLDNFNQLGLTPLVLAYENDSFEIIKLLIDRGANLYSSEEFNLMHRACIDNKTKVISIILDKYNNKYLDEPDENGLTPLHYACNNRSIDAVNLLLSKGANPNGTFTQQIAPLTLSCLYGSYDIAEILLKKKAHIEPLELLIDSCDDLYFLPFEDDSLLIKTLLKSSNLSVRIKTAFHVGNNRVLTEGFSLYYNTLGPSEATSLAQKLKLSPDFTYNNDLTVSLTDHIKTFIQETNMIENRINNSKRLLHKLFYKKELQSCLNKILLFRKKLHQIRSLLSTLDTFDFLEKPLSPEKNQERNINI